MRFALVKLFFVNAVKASNAFQSDNELQTASDDVPLYGDGDSFSTLTLSERDDQYTADCNDTACTVQCYEQACLHRQLPVPCPGKVTGSGFNVTIYNFLEGADIDPSQDFYDTHYADYGIIGTNTGIEDLTLPFTEVADNDVKETIYGVEDVTVAHFVADFRGFTRVNETGIYTIQVFPLDYAYYGLGTNATTCCGSFGEYTEFRMSVGGTRQPDSLEPNYDPNLFISHYLYAGVYYPTRVLFVSNKRAPQFEFRFKGPTSDNYTHDLSGFIFQMDNSENCAKLNPPTIDSSSIDTDSTTTSSSSPSTSYLPTTTDSSISADQTDASSYATSSSSSSASYSEVPSNTSSSTSYSYTSSSSIGSSSKSGSYATSDPSSKTNTTESSYHTIESSSSSDSHVDISTSSSKSGLPSITNPSASGTSTKTGPYTIGSSTGNGPYVEVGPTSCKSDPHIFTDTTTNTNTLHISASNCSDDSVETGPSSSNSYTSDLTTTKAGPYRNGTAAGSVLGSSSSAGVFSNMGNNNIFNRFSLILSSLFALLMLY